jgi:adenosylhomocysteine nucleosidase
MMDHRRGVQEMAIVHDRKAADCSYASEKPPVLIQGAMKMETEALVSSLTEVQEYQLGRWYFAAGWLDGYPIVVGRTQWGVANAAAATALAMEFFRPMAVISQGTAGGHDPALHTYDIVIGTRTVNESAWQSAYAVHGAGVDYRALKQLGVFAYDKTAGEFTQQPYHDADPSLLAAASAVCGNYGQGQVVPGTIGTCDSWNCQVDRILFLHEFYGSLAEDMEGDAVAQICQTYDVPFLDIRILSNTVFEGNKDWVLDAGTVCQAYVLDLVRQYISQAGPI